MPQQPLGRMGRWRCMPMVRDAECFPTGNRQGLNLPDARAINEQGNVIPIDPRNTPEAVVRAMNTDYTDFMKNLNDRTRRG
jgi:hypothetical protein